MFKGKIQFNVLKLMFQTTKNNNSSVGSPKSLVIEILENDVFLICMNSYKLKIYCIYILNNIFYYYYYCIKKT